MSRSAAEDEQGAAQRRDAQESLRRMIDEGRSFSGHERNCFFLNLGDGTFATASAVAGLDKADDARALATADWDHDGDLDVWISNRNAPRLRLLRNQLPRAGHFLMLRLVGNGTTVNRDAIGARVDVQAESLDGRPLTRTVRAGEGFLSQSSKWLHIGLGELDEIESVRVRWPDGSDEEFRGLAVDRRFRLVQGGRVAEPVADENRRLALPPAPQPRGDATSTAAIRLLHRLPLPRLSFYETFRGARTPVPYGAGRPLLVCFWSRTCKPCLEELQELARRRDEIRKAGLDVIALSVDALGDEAERAAAVRGAEQVVSRFAFPFASGMASGEFVQLLQGYHNLLVVLVQQLPVPCSFLLDAEGRLQVIYKGRVPLDALLRDVRARPRTHAERLAWSAPLAGRSLESEQLAETMLRAEARTLFTLAKAFDGRGLAADAARMYRGVVERVPDFMLAHQRLGLVLQQLGQTEAAAAHYERAIALGGRQAWVFHNLGTLLIGQRRLADAERCFRAALRADRRHLESYVNLAAVLSEAGRDEEAARQLEQALEIDPQYEPARKGLRALREG